MNNDIKKLDGRYSIALEWCGYAVPHYVVRFCDQWVGSAPDVIEAISKALSHNDERMAAL